MRGPNGALQGRGFGLLGSPVRYDPVKVRSALRQVAQPDGPWHWVVDPYRGCEFGCTYCSARLDRRDTEEWVAYERRIDVRANVVEAFLRDVRAPDFEHRQVALGTSADPWQPAEEHFRVTRSLLEAMAKVDGVDLRVHTRSSLVARDGDVLRQIDARGRVAVAISIASMDEAVNRLMEPRAPSAFRRLMAVEALAREGLTVGLMVSPVFPGLDDDELSLNTLLGRAAHAGARFAGIELLSFGPGQRENFLTHVTTCYPDAASRFRRIVGRRPPSEEDRAALTARFEDLCAKIGLTPLHRATFPRLPDIERPVEQLSLFGRASPV